MQSLIYCSSGIAIAVRRCSIHSYRYQLLLIGTNSGHYLKHISTSEGDYQQYMLIIHTYRYIILSVWAISSVGHRQ